MVPRSSLGNRRPSPVALTRPRAERRPIVAGTLTGFGSFIADGVRCNDSGATPTAASEWRSVDAEGSMVAGVLRATKRRLR